MSDGPRQPAPPESLIEPFQEVRFAVVMYGGVSLAIYINGVAQELLRLVRATAPKRKPSPAAGAPVGGLLEAMLGDSHAPPASEPLAAGADPLDEVYRELGRRYSPGGTLRPGNTGPVRTRFIVDILSGTSAGGINAIFLAKALANDQSMDELAKLWITEGDLDVLLNDAGSRTGMFEGYRKEASTWSLLDSTRMYHKLLVALDGLDGPKGAASRRDDNWRSPLVDELDLFVTATDLTGLKLPLRLADRTVFERRHRAVFRFLYASEHGTGDPRNDFLNEINGFLAFAARSTSSFPVAFEPMRLEDVQRVPAFSGPTEDFPARLGTWGPFFKDYLVWHEGLGRRVEATECDFPRRAFGDGGYLDNKPFSYAIDAIGRRRADARVERKLLYVEPSPEHPERVQDRLDRPDAFENLNAATLLLPRAEPIRQDLERILARNRLAERIERAVREIDTDVDHGRTATELLYRFERLPGATSSTDRSSLLEHPSIMGGATWAATGMRDMIRAYGPGYGTYHRLKVAAVTSDLASLVARHAGFDEESDEGLAVRYLVSAWRQVTFVPDARKEGRWTGEPSDPRHAQAGRSVPAGLGALPRTENQLLLSFDLAYRIRRIAFLQNRLDQFLALTRQSIGVLKNATRAAPALDDAEADRLVNSPALRDDLRRRLARLKAKLGDVLVHLRKHGRRVRSPRSAPEIANGIRALGLGQSHLLDILSLPGIQNRTRRAAELLAEDGRLSRVDALSVRLAEEFRPIYSECSLAVRAICGLLERGFDQADERWFSIQERFDAELATGADGVVAKALRLVRERIKTYYNQFDWYDATLFPLLEGTDVGELDAVEVVRVSPGDADLLVREGAGEPSQLKKLAGTRLASFGAFLDRTWRKSDILWGRLDGAERIIRALVPDPAKGTVDPEAAKLILRAHQAIVDEHLRDESDDHGRDVLVEAFLHSPDVERGRDALCRMVKELKPGIRSDRVLKMLEWKELSAHFERRFATARQLGPEATVRLAARGTAVFGALLDTHRERYRVLSRFIPWALTWIGRVGWGLVEIAIPRSLHRIVAGYWLSLLYVFEGLLLVLGIVFDQPAIRQVGLLTFGVTLAIDFSRHLIAYYVTRGKNGRVALWALAIVALALAILGAESLSARLDRIAKGIDPRVSTIAGVVAAAVAAILVIYWAVAGMLSWRKRWDEARRMDPRPERDKLPHAGDERRVTPPDPTQPADRSRRGRGTRGA